MFRKNAFRGRGNVSGRNWFGRLLLANILETALVRLGSDQTAVAPRRINVDGAPVFAGTDGNAGAIVEHALAGQLTVLVPLLSDQVGAIVVDAFWRSGWPNQLELSTSCGSIGL